MSRFVKAVVAILGGLLVFGAMQGHNAPVRGLGGEWIGALFSLAILGAFGYGLFAAVHALQSSPGMGGGQGGRGIQGASPQEIRQLQQAVTQRFDRLDQAVNHVQTDATHTRQMVTEVRDNVRRLVQMMRHWGQKLGQFQQVLTNMRSTISQGIQDIHRNVAELNDWRRNQWPAFEQFVRQDLGKVLAQGQAMATEINHLRGEVQAVQQGRQGVDTIVKDLQAKQAQLQQEVQTGFQGVPAAVQAQVKGDLQAMQAALSADIGRVELAQGAMKNMFASFEVRFAAFGTAVQGQLAGLPAATAQAVKAQIDDVYKLIRGALMALLDGQTTMEGAIARLTAAQAELKAGLSALPAGVALALQPKIDGMQKVLEGQLARLQTDQSTLKSAVGDLGTKSEEQTGLILTCLQGMREESKKELQGELDDLALTLLNDLYPLTKDMQGLNAQIVQVLQQIGAQGQSIERLRVSTDTDFGDLLKYVVTIGGLLKKIDEEGAKAKVLDDVSNDVGVILDWLGQHGPNLEKLGGEAPKIVPLLDQLRALIEKTKVKEKQVKEKAGKIVKKTEGAVTNARQIRFNQDTYDSAAVTFVANVQWLIEFLDTPQLVDVHQERIREALVVLTRMRDRLCKGRGSCYVQLRPVYEASVQEQERVVEFERPWRLLSSLCTPAGKWNELLKDAQEASQRKELRPEDVNVVNGLLKKMAATMEFKEVARALGQMAKSPAA